MPSAKPFGPTDLELFIRLEVLLGVFNTELERIKGSRNWTNQEGQCKAQPNGFNFILALQLTQLGFPTYNMGIATLPVVHLSLSNPIPKQGGETETGNLETMITHTFP